MKTLTEIEFELDRDAIMAEAHVEAGSDDAEELAALLALAREHGRPKAAYTVQFVAERAGDRVQVGDVWFESRALVHNLANAERVFPHVATCGRELGEVFPAKGDMLKEWWWDLIQSRLLTAANAALSAHLNTTYRLGKTAMMRPGSGDTTVWPVEQQRELFALLGDVRQTLGVALTDSFLMVPSKTTSGILFRTDADFHSCEVCHREDCPSRRAPFDPQLWDAVSPSSHPASSE